MVELLLNTAQLDTITKEYIFDYDNQFILTGKHDSKRFFKKSDSYFQGIATIYNIPVYIVNSNGNSNVEYK